VKTQRFEIPALQRAFEAHVRAWEEAEARLLSVNQEVLELAGEEPFKTPVSYLRCLKGIDTLSAMTLIAEIQEFRRFSAPTKMMSFTGLTPAEHSSGASVRRLGIAKTGNAHARRILVEAAWSYRRPNLTGRPLLKRREVCPPEIVHLARKAQDRLHRRFHRLVSRGKPGTVAATAVARELTGFVWAMAQRFPAV
jgi:transposase